MLGATWRVLRACVTGALVILLLAAPVRMVQVNLDGDDDGLSDCRERAGLRADSGADVYVTDPDRADTDGDQISDADEVGEWIRPESAQDVVDLLFRCDRQSYSSLSDPGSADTDFDGLSDAEELSDGSDVFLPDSDGDGLQDAAERTWGSDPNATDTDGDGFLDVEDVSGGLMPVVVDVVEDHQSWEREYSEGLYYGDVRESDSVAQLLGSLSGGASSGIPFVGWVTGTLADARDIAANAANGEWGQAGMSGAGLLPYVGDAAKAASKTSRFVAMNPELVGRLTRQIATWDKLPDAIRTRLLGATDKRSYDALVESKLSDDEIVALVGRGAKLANVAKLLNQAAATLAVGSSSEVDADGFLISLADAQAELRQVVAETHRSTGGPVWVLPDREIPQGRLFDACSACQAGPTPKSSTLYVAKLGSQVLSRTIQSQIGRDAELRSVGYLVEWHFFAGRTGLDIDPMLVDALVDADIPYVVHLPD